MPFYFHCSKPAIAKSFRLARFGSRARLCRRSSAEVSARDLPANCKFAMEVLLVASRFDHLPSSLVADVEPNACIVTLRGYFVARMCSLGNCKLGHRRLDFQLCNSKGVCPRNLWLECVRRHVPNGFCTLNLFWGFHWWQAWLQVCFWACFLSLCVPNFWNLLERVARQVEQDLHNWIPRVKPGRVVAGHDYRALIQFLACCAVSLCGIAFCLRS